MTDQPDDKKYMQKNVRGSLTPEETLLWQTYVKNVDPLVGKRPPPAGETENAPSLPKRRASLPTPPAAKLSSAVPAQSRELDFRTDQKLRRGRMEIEGTLDLHGMTQPQAYAAVNDFIMQVHRRGARCVLIITGKGKGGTDGGGILRQRLADWLALPPLQTLILKTAPAQPRHGGSGAFYVYLKRTRKSNN